MTAALLLLACGDGSGDADAGGGSGIDAGARDAGATGEDAGRRDARVSLPDAQPAPDGGASTADAGGGGDDAGVRITGTCADPVPVGAEEPAPLPTYGGTCPTLAPGRNTITSSGESREFLLVVPDALDPSEELPVIFMWHWLGGDADGFRERGEVQAAADALRFLAVIPEERGDLSLKWPYLVPPAHSDARRDEELAFFDDMLACVAEQYPVNRHCVSSAGVSAGALWTGQLAQHRSEHLSSILSLSGGVGTGSLIQPVREWTGAAHAMPALVLWGGPTDFCGVDFDTASMALEDGLVAGGHYVVECVHNCAHSQPPIDTDPGVSAFEALWRFALDHPYWLADGISPWMDTGLPAGTPDWCAQGAGAATIREGECEGGVLGDCT